MIFHIQCSNILLYQPFIENNNNFTWEQYLNEQSSNNRMAGGIFIMATAILIGLDIYINSVQCNQSQPVNIIKRYWQEPDIPNRNDHPFLLIGHFQQHFQSLIPVTEMDITTVRYSHKNTNIIKVDTLTASYSDKINSKLRFLYRQVDVSKKIRSDHHTCCIINVFNKNSRLRALHVQ